MQGLGVGVPNKKGGGVRQKIQKLISRGDYYLELKSTPFVEQRKYIDRSSTLYSVKTPFELVHADIGDIRSSSKSAVEIQNFIC